MNDESLDYEQYSLEQDGFLYSLTEEDEEDNWWETVD